MVADTQMTELWLGPGVKSKQQIEYTMITWGKTHAAYCPMPRVVIIVPSDGDHGNAGSVELSQPAPTES